MKDPCVCIILVNYNNLEDTEECVRSLKTIEYSNYNIIVVDNASNNGSNILDNLYLKNNSIIIKSKTNDGFSSGNNIAIKWARENINPDYYLLLNNDTVVKTNFLDPLVKISQKQKNRCLVGGKILYYDNPNMIWYAGGYYDSNNGFAGHDGFNEIDNGMNFIEQKQVSFITGCLMLIPKEIVDEFGLLDESFFLYSEDLEYCCRLKSNGISLIYSPESIIYHKVSASSGRNSKFQQYYMLRNDLYIISKYCNKKFLSYLKRLNWCRLNRINIIVVLRSFKDFICRKKGRVDYKW